MFYPLPVRKAVFVYGFAGALLIVALRLVEYRFLVLEHSVQIYGALIASLFAGLGIWLGVTLTRQKGIQAATIQPVADRSFTANVEKIQSLGITPRELEILKLIADGMSTREIASALFVSENTVKTHASRLFGKLDVNRRTKAVQVAKTMGLIP